MFYPVITFIFHHKRRFEELILHTFALLIRLQYIPVGLGPKGPLEFLQISFKNRKHSRPIH